ncbi:ABC transporter permease [Sulfurifustis variabilis]|uniref:ABC transporter permease n=1 Tax=Sulfurifustis variabilis TaxID=1675686 RepID=A0A1B4V2G7_9GAMM|nr:iron ABC transporter permease [Sulfurifustis variabilis]BAU47730.1 ABC transporter permease [Sulfurifustis variabilis]
MRRPLAITLLLLAAAPLSILIALAAGSVSLSLDQLWTALASDAPGVARTVVLELRLPRALAALAVGGMLGLAGALLQVLLRNPLADPYVLGISGGAAVGALLAIALGAAGVLVGGAAFAGAIASMLLVFGLARAGGAWTQSRLLLTGVVLAAGWGACVSLLLAISPAMQVQGMVFWLLGDLGYAREPAAGLVVLVSGLALAMLYARPLNLLARGERVAAALGERPAHLRVLVYFLASLLSAVAVTLAGSIGFVGLVVPHLLRLLGLTDHRWLLPNTVLLGGALLVIADALARTVLAPVQLPVGVLTALIGVPAFLYLLARATDPGHRTHGTP